MIPTLSPRSNGRPVLTGVALCAWFLSMAITPVAAQPAFARTPAFDTPSWTTLSGGMTARAYLAAATAPDGKIYTIGGSNVHGRPNQLNTAEVFDPATGQTSPLPPMPRQRDGLAAAIGSDGRLYVFGGHSLDGFIAEVDAYDPRTNTWSTPTRMPTPRSGLAAAASLDGRIVTIGGDMAGGEITGVVEVFDPWCNQHSQSGGRCTIANSSGQPLDAPVWDTWHDITPRSVLAAATDTRGWIYALGGVDGSGALAKVEAVQVPDLTTELGNARRPTWRLMPDLPTPRYGLAAAIGPDRVYALGGTGANQLPSDAVEVYQTTSASWSTVASMPTPRTGLAAATDARDRIYALGGYHPQGLDFEYPSQVDVFTPGGASVTAEPGTWSAGAPMPTGREGLAATVGKDGEVYVLGGFHDTDGAPLATLEAYRPSATNLSAWTTLPPMPTPRAYLAAAAAGDTDNYRIYAIGGYRGAGAPVADPSVRPALAAGCGASVTCDEHNVSNLPEGVYDVRYAWRSQDGTTRGSPESTIFDIHAGQSIEVTLPVLPADAIGADVYARFTELFPGGQIPAGVACPPWRLMATTTDTVVWLSTAPDQGWPDSCGQPEAAPDDMWPASNTTAADGTAVEAYDPAARTWTAVAPLPIPLWGLAAAQGKDGYVFVFGGAAPGGGASDSVLSYDVRQNTWQAPLSGSSEFRMPGGPRVLLAATAGIDGRFYILGGNTGGNQAGVDTLDRVEIYDPATDTWSLAAPMLTPRQGLAAIAAPDGKIYAIGGSNGANVHLSTAEAYDPTTDTWTLVPSMRNGRRDLAAAAVPGGCGSATLLALGGHGGQLPYNDVEAYVTADSAGC